MFDIGFTELLLIGVVALLVIGPERLPETIRTAALWLKRIRRGFNEIKQEVQQELHNDAVMQDLRKTGEQLKKEANSIGQDVQKSTAALSSPAHDANVSTASHQTPADQTPVTQATATQSPAEKPAE